MSNSDNNSGSCINLLPYLVPKSAEHLVWNKIVTFLEENHIAKYSGTITTHDRTNMKCLSFEIRDQDFDDPKFTMNLTKCLEDDELLKNAIIPAAVGVYQDVMRIDIIIDPEADALEHYYKNFYYNSEENKKEKN